MRAATPRTKRIILGLVLLAPVVAFFALQSIIGATRSGSLEEVWFVRTQGGPMLVARDRIAVGTQRSVSWRDRLVLVDLATGRRLARRKVDAPLQLIDASDEALWFQRPDGSDLQARSARTLERFQPRGASPKPSGGSRRSRAPGLPAATLPDGSRVAAPDGGAASPEKSFLLADAITGEAISLSDPPSALAVTPVPDGLVLSRIQGDGGTVWRALLERQRAVRAAAHVGDVVVVITSGPARDFAVSVEARTGKTRWVHHF